MSILEFDDGIGGRLRGTLHAPGATPGDVLTVGATRGAISPSPGGGSQPVKVVRVPLAWDTPGLADGGVDVYTPTPGELIHWPLSYFSVPTVGFDTTSTDAWFYLTFTNVAGALFSASLQNLPQVGLTDDAATFPPFLFPLLNTTGAWVNIQAPVLFPDATPLRAVIDDGASGTPDLTAGEGVLSLYIIVAA